MRFRIALLLVFGSALSTACVVGSSPRYHTRVYVEPSARVVSISATFAVNVSIADVPPTDGVWGFSLKLLYNTTILNATAAEIPDGHFFTPATSPGIFIVDKGTIYEDEGYVSFALACLAPEPDKTGNGTLARVTFRAERAGTSHLTVSDIIMVRSACGPWTPDEYMTYHGLVTVVQPDLTPLVAQLTLFTSAIFALTLFLGGYAKRVQRTRM